MLNRIRLKNFKCFQDKIFSFKRLNVLTGLNGTGKSTLIQSLLLHIQTSKLRLLGEALSLNGVLTSNGNAKDIICEFGEDNKIEFSFLFEDAKEASFIYEYNSEMDYLKVEKSNGSIEDLYGILNRIDYLGAMRITPNSIYPKSDFEVTKNKQIGSMGEYSAHYLYKYGTEEILNTKVLHGGVTEKLLKNQLQAWFQDIVPNTLLDFDNYLNADYISLKYRFNLGETEVSNYYRPSNVGFGLTYILPVLLVLLKSKENDIIIIENPEAHLHPSGQRKIGELISKVSAGGVQVFVETHSDHVINGIRLAVKNGEIDTSETNLMYFKRENVNGQAIHTIDCPIIQTDGRLSYWPEGFFDEWDKAIEELF